MRAFIWFVICAALIGGFVVHKQRQESTATAETQSATPTPRPATSKYNMPKRALDRANDVKAQVAAQRKSDEVP